MDKKQCLFCMVGAYAIPHTCLVYVYAIPHAQGAYYLYFVPGNSVLKVLWIGLVDCDV